MIYSLTGKIIRIEPTYLVIENQGLGYRVWITHPEQFTLDQVTTLLTHQVFKEDDQYLVGFKTDTERQVFEDLISVKGIGPKTALAALSGSSPEDIIKAISSNNVTFLKSLPGIGPKAAAQIILDLKGKLTDGGKGNPIQYQEVKEALKSLGFKSAEIDKVLTTINIPNGSTEEILKQALKQLRKT